MNLNKDLLEACGLSNSYNNPDESIDDKIESMKKDGINYSSDLFQQLLTIVNLKNIVTVDTTFSYPNKVQRFNDILNELKQSPNDIIPETLVTNLSELLDRYSLKEEKAVDSSRKFKIF